MLEDYEAKREVGALAHNLLARYNYGFFSLQLTEPGQLPWAPTDGILISNWPLVEEGETKGLRSGR